MEFVLPERDLIQFVRRNFDAALIRFLVKTDFDCEASLRRRGCNQIHDGLIVRQGTPTPIHADVRKKAMLNLVPLARSRREVAHRYSQRLLIGELLQFSFP
jgi:hypothetical protein